MNKYGILNIATNEQPYLITPQILSKNLNNQSKVPADFVELFCFHENVSRLQNPTRLLVSLHIFLF